MSPEGDAFTFETETETVDETSYFEESDDEEFYEPVTILVPGEGHTGWAVAASLIAPFAVIALSDYSVFEDGSEGGPAIEPYSQDQDGNEIHPESRFRKVHGEKLFGVLEKLRSRIVDILEKQDIAVLPEEEWRKEVPGLRAEAEVLVGDAVGRPVRVLDAFFFEGF